MSNDNRYVITDCGSTTTKAVLIELIDGVFRQKYRGESSTTVEEPFLDVTVGVKNALKQLEVISGLKLFDSDGGIISNSESDSGCGMYLSTSSAGGGLQMVVMGMISSISCDSALKAALGAGAIVFDTISFDDFEGTTPFEYVETLRQMRPDMVLLAGGTEGGQREGVAELAQLLKAASPRPRFGDSYKMPVIYAGNSEIAEEIKRILNDCADVIVESNVRPDMENENIDGARKRIHTLFLEHVMQHSPGFSKLSALVDFEILPTPLAVGDMLKLYAKSRNRNVLCADIGGATTDIFSVVDGHFNRTVSANLGMSYSASFVLAKSGIENITRWVPHLDKKDVYNQILNKTVLPASLPADLDELDAEHALAREALSHSFEQHCEFSKGLKGTITGRNIDGGFSIGNKPLVTGANIDVIIASGGVLSHAPEEIHTIAMVVDSFLPSGITLIAKDSIFMLPHLGVLSKVNKKAAMDVFENDCIINLCTHVAPVYKNDNLPKIKKECLAYTIAVDSKVYTGLIKSNELYLIKLPENIEAELEIEMKRGWRIDNRGKLKTKVVTGTTGILFDTRGRPLNHDTLLTFKDIKIIDKRDSAVNSDEKNGYNFNFSAAPLTVDNRVEISRKITIPQNGEVLVKEGEHVSPGQEIITYQKSGKIDSIPFCSHLGIPPVSIFRALKVKEKDFVKKGDLLGEYSTFLGFVKRAVYSPSSGIIESVSDVSGNLLIREDSIQLSTITNFDGIVSKISSEFLMIDSLVTLIQGVSGAGREVYGELVDIQSEKDFSGSIIFSKEPIDRQILEELKLKGAIGVAAPSIDGMELVDFAQKDLNFASTGSEDLGITIFLTEGFGIKKIDESKKNLLEKLLGKKIILKGETQVRAGVIRPEIIGPPRLEDD